MRPLEKLSPGQLVKGEDYNRLLELIAGMRVMVGPGLNKQTTSGGTVISIVKHPLDHTHGGIGGGGGDTATGLWARITRYGPDVTPLGEWLTFSLDNRYIYEWERFEKTARGYSTGTAWVTSTVEPATGTAYNACEAMNNGADREGNGVDVNGADFPAGFRIMPAPVGSIVWLNIVAVPDWETTEYWFSHENAVDGTCAAP